MRKTTCLAAILFLAALFLAACVREPLEPPPFEIPVAPNARQQACMDAIWPLFERVAQVNWRWNNDPSFEYPSLSPGAREEFWTPKAMAIYETLLIFHAVTFYGRDFASGDEVEAYASSLPDDPDAQIIIYQALGDWYGALLDNGIPYGIADAFVVRVYLAVGRWECFED